MAVERDKLKALLDGAFPDGKVDVVPFAEDNDHYSITIESEKFAGKSKLDQHRMVHAALSGVEIHALQIKTSIGKRNE